MASSLKKEKPTDHSFRSKGIRINVDQVNSAYAARMLFTEIVDVEAGKLTSIVNNAIVVGVIVILILGFLIWNNVGAVKWRMLFTLLGAVVIYSIMGWFNASLRSAFSHVKDTGHKMIDGFTHANKLNEIQYLNQLGTSSRRNEMLQERSGALKEGIGMSSQ